MGVQALRLDTEGVATVIDLGPDTANGLREHIGCRWFDCVGLTDGIDMWLDDEGAIVADPIVNVAATAIARHYGRVWQPYCGTVVFASHDQHGNTTSLDAHTLDALRDLAQ